jgi:hypothetical protein
MAKKGQLHLSTVRCVCGGPLEHILTPQYVYFAMLQVWLYGGGIFISTSFLLSI